MKPYFAILIDSFWEAVSSKVLWGLLVCWTLLLGGLAPFGYVSEVGYELSRGDIINTLGLAQKLAKGLTTEANEKQKHISRRLSEGFRKQLSEAGAKRDSKERNAALDKISRRELTAELNKLLADRELYKPELFESVSKLDAVKPILAKSIDNRTELDLEYLNRQVLRMTYSADLRAPRDEQIWFGYAGIKIGNQLPFDRTQINMFIEGVALQLIIRLGLSFVVVFVGLIITSSMIPDTFRSGSLHLLLSKPISRPLVYLTKFFGGTLFVLINIAYLLVGLFLLVGWRLGLWNAGLIWCIPLLLFVFVIFYSVSALVGLIWNNPIICVVVCIVFWIFCLTVGALEGGMRMPAVWMPQIVRFVKVDDDLLTITQSSEVNVWNEQFQVWQPAVDLNSQGPGRVVGPFHDVERQRLILRSDFLNGMGDFETRNRNLIVADLKQPNQSAKSGQRSKSSQASSPNKDEGNVNAESESTADAGKAPGAKTDTPSPAEDNSIPKNVDEARRKPHWPSENGVEPPMLMIDIINLQGRTLSVTRNGIFEIDWKALDLTDEAKSKSSIFGELANVFNRLQPQSFKDLSPSEYIFGDSVRITKTPDEKNLLIFNSNTVDSLKFDDSIGKFVVEHSIQLGEEARQSALIAASNEFVVVGRENKPLVILDRQLSKTVASLPMPGQVDPRQIYSAADANRFSIVTHDDRLWILDAPAQKLTVANCPWQGSVTGVTWVNAEQMWVGIRPNRAALLNVTTGKVERTLVPAASRLDFFYNWIARPLYLVSPKPSSLNGVLQKLLQRDRAGQTQLFNNDLSAFRVEIEVWQPVISNLVFVAVFLGLGCIYVWRREW